VTLTASPASGWSFGAWGGGCLGTGDCTLTMTDNRSVTGMFSAPASRIAWPLNPDNRSYLGQDYAEYNLGKTGYYHTGLDIGGLDITPVGTPVFAAASGHVRGLKMGDLSGHPYNYCMGNVVIIDHAGFFTLYAHLNEILVNDGAFVSAGLLIGTVGTTGWKDCGQTSVPHLHFEVKDRGVLGDLRDDGPSWGYTLTHPDDNHYHDPMTRLHDITTFVRRRVRVTQDSANLRVGPGGAGATSYRSIGGAHLNDEYGAVALAGRTNYPDCANGWYQLQRIDGQRFVESYPFVPGEIPDAWICADLVSTLDRMVSVTALVNKSDFSAGDTLTATAGVTNGVPADAAAAAYSADSVAPDAADFFLGLLFPDGNTIAFFTSPDIRVETIAFGALADLGSFRPIGAGVPLSTPFSATVPNLFSYRITGSEQLGEYAFFFLAARAGALVTGAITRDDIAAAFATGVVTNTNIVGFSRMRFSVR
jgi:murein DD-endopeptidase MepM/ murein hydrolase activator NlpD